MQLRIGERDPRTGLYAVIWPDGSTTLNGQKVFNSAHEVGDLVLATRRSDGMMILDAAKASDGSDGSNSIDREIGVKEFGSKPIGYLNGQVFNNEDEIVVPRYLMIQCISYYDPFYVYGGGSIGLQSCPMLFSGSTPGAGEIFRAGHKATLSYPRLYLTDTSLASFGSFSPLYLTSPTIGSTIKRARLEDNIIYAPPPDRGFFEGIVMYELQVDTLQWPGASTEVKVTPVEYKLRSSNGFLFDLPIPPDRCEMKVALRQDRISQAQSIDFQGFDKIRAYEDFLNFAIQPPDSPLVSKTAFIVKYDKRNGRVSVA
jgi:hypothetical protein